MPSPYHNQLTALQASIQSFATGIKDKFSEQSALVATDYGIPYFTGAIVEGKEQWGVVLDFGVMPNTSTKVYLIPQWLKDEWGPPGKHWIDTGNTFFFNPTTGMTNPLPFISQLDFQGGAIDGTQVVLKLTDDELIVETSSDRTDFHCIVVIKYLKYTPV